MNKLASLACVVALLPAAASALPVTYNDGSIHSPELQPTDEDCYVSSLLLLNDTQQKTESEQATALTFSAFWMARLSGLGYRYDWPTRAANALTLTPVPEYWSRVGKTCASRMEQIVAPFID